jgi:hypothetical protein
MNWVLLKMMNNALGTWKIMNSALGTCTYLFLIVYLDDKLIFNSTWEEYISQKVTSIGYTQEATIVG